MKNEPLLVAIENGIAENVGRKEIACELDALKGETKRTGERLRECRLANAGNVFNKQMTSGKQTRDGELDRLGFTDDDLTDLIGECDDLLCNYGVTRELRLNRK